MKQLTTLTFILFTSCMNSALAKGVQYTCREATPIYHGYLATLVPGGSVIQISMNSFHSKKVKVSFSNENKVVIFKAKIRFPGPRTQGDMGGFVNKREDFSLNFAVLPNFKEISTQQEYLGGDFYLNGLEMFMLCDAGVREIYN